MTDMIPDHAEEAAAEFDDNAVPGRGYQLTPLVGLGGSAGAIPALQKLLQSMPADSGMAFVVVLHLAPEHESELSQILQRSSGMRVVQVHDRHRVEANTVYVIPPRKAIRTLNGHLHLADDPLSPRGRHVAVDLFFRALADSHGPHAAAVVLSGADGDGTLGIKRIKERGGITVAQDPQEAEQPSMPRSAIATGMVDWVLPVADIARRLLAYFDLQKNLRLPPEEGPEPGTVTAAAGSSDEAHLRDVLAFLRNRTGRDFSYYKRATVVRRIARRMRVSGVQDMAAYLDCLRTRPGEAGALLQDLLISVTNFFRDADCFAALDSHLGTMAANRGANDAVRVWVVACATGEEAYTVAMLLCEKTRQMEAPPVIQVFATDLDGEAIRIGREGIYPSTIEADVSPERLRRFFTRERHGYRVRREVREMVLFAQHDLLKDSPFSRLDLVTCRNLLIYLNGEAQRRAFQIFHFALAPRGLLFIGSSESAEEANPLFAVLDKKHRVYTQRPTPLAVLPVPSGRGRLALDAPTNLQLGPADRELERLKAHLRDTVEQYEASNEELKASNEELQAMNEELRSAIEELESSREELQSINEELTAVNHELKGKVDDLGHANSDMLNLMDATAIATVFLDRDLRMTRYTPAAVSLFNLNDITERKQSEDARLWLSAVVASSTDAIVSFAMDQTLLSWNAGAQRIFGYSAEEAIGRTVGMLWPDENEARQRDQVMSRLREGKSITNLEVSRRRKDGSDVAVALAISPIRDAQGTVLGGTAIARDITQQRQAAEALRSSDERLRMIVENARDYAIFSTDLQRRVTI